MIMIYDPTENCNLYLIKEKKDHDLLLTKKNCVTLETSHPLGSHSNNIVLYGNNNEVFSISFFLTIKNNILLSE